MSKLRIAVIGAGAIGRAHAQTISRSTLCTLAAIAEPTVQGKEVANHFGVPWHPDAIDLLDKIKPDAAIIATPNSTHRALALACIDRGIPSIVEKPIASDIADAQEIVRAVERKKVPVLVGHHRRYNPIIRRARSVIGEGLLGQLTTASILYAFYKPPEYFDLAWRKGPGGGPILINLIHEIDLVRHLCGEILSVQAITSNKTRQFEVEDSAVAMLRLVNGALVTLNLSDTAVTPWSWDLASGESPNYPSQPVPVATHFLCGTEGALSLPTLEHWNYRGRKSWFNSICREALTVEREDPYFEQLHHLCRVTRGDQEPLISAADGTLTLRATLAVQKSAATGETISFA